MRTEHYLFLNEFFSACGLFLCVKSLRSFPRKDLILLSIYFLLIYGLLRAIISACTIQNSIAYFRSLVLWYSIFSFFVGSYIMTHCKKAFESGFYQKIAPGIALISLVTGNSIATPALYPMLFKSYRYSFAIILLLLILLCIYLKEYTLALMIAVFICLTVVFFSKKLTNILFNPLNITLLFLLFFIFIIVGGNYFIYDFYFNNYSIFPHIPPNILWRYMFWCYATFTQLFLHPLMGIGFGTPIFNSLAPETSFITFTNTQANPLFSYVLGTHNFIIDLLVRLGCIGFIPVFIIYLVIFNKITHYSKQSFSYFIFLSFIFITLGGLANVMLVTPIFASSYWILLGMLCQCFKLEARYYE